MRRKRANGEGTIYHRKDGRWAAIISLGAGMRKTYYRQTRDEALLALQQAQHARMQGTLTSTREETVETFLLNWLQYQIQPKVRERTYQTYHQTVMQDLLPSLGQIALQKLTHWHIQRLYYQKKRQRAAPSTIHKIHRILRHALNDAVKLGHALRNVGQDVELPPEKKRERATQALTIEQARKLLAGAQDDPLEPLYVLALTTGMRQGELLALKWSDLDLTYGKLQVQRTLIRVRGGKATVAEPKSPTSRRCIQLTQLAIDALQRHAQRQQAARKNRRASKRIPEWVFCDARGVPLRANGVVRQSFQPLLAKAELPRIRFHDLRHSTATLLLMLGVHPKIVQELLGHSQIFITLDIYSNILPTLQGEAMQRLNQCLTSPNHPEHPAQHERQAFSEPPSSYHAESDLKAV
jgi:integrase